MRKNSFLVWHRSVTQRISRQIQTWDERNGQTHRTADPTDIICTSQPNFTTRPRLDDNEVRDTNPSYQIRTQITISIQNWNHSVRYSKICAHTRNRMDRRGERGHREPLRTRHVAKDSSTIQVLTRRTRLEDIRLTEAMAPNRDQSDQDHGALQRAKPRRRDARTRPIYYYKSQAIRCNKTHLQTKIWLKLSKGRLRKKTPHKHKHLSTLRSPRWDSETRLRPMPSTQRPAQINYQKLNRCQNVYEELLSDIILSNHTTETIIKRGTQRNYEKVDRIRKQAVTEIMQLFPTEN